LIIRQNWSYSGHYRVEFQINGTSDSFTYDRELFRVLIYIQHKFMHIFLFKPREKWNSNNLFVPRSNRSMSRFHGKSQRFFFFILHHAISLWNHLPVTWYFFIIHESHVDGLFLPA
jgi:hypothetical protein